MGLIPKEQLRQWIQEKNMKSMEDVQSAIKELFADTIQEMLEAELETELGYAKHDFKNKRTSNSRNGYSKKSVRSEYGDIDIKIPRDREGEFNIPLSSRNISRTSQGSKIKFLRCTPKAFLLATFRIICSNSTELRSHQRSFPT